MTIRVTKFGIEAVGNFPGKVFPLALGNSLPPISEPDWTSPMRIDHAWLTDISHSKSTLTEERRSLRKRPRRTFESTVSSFSQLDASRVLMSLLQYGKSRNEMPVYPDRMQLLNATGSNILVCDTEFRLLFQGQRIAVVPIDWGTVTVGVPGNAVYGIIKEIEPNRIILENALPTTMSVGSHIYPMISAEYVLRTQASALSDFYSNITLNYEEASGPSQLPPTWKGEIESYFPYFNDTDAGNLPIFWITPDWNGDVSTEILREGSRFDAGRGYGIDTEGTQPIFSWEFSFGPDTRQNAWKLLQFFDSRRGRTLAFWIANPQTIFSLVTIISTTQIDVTGFRYFGNIATFLKYMAIEDIYGNIYVRKITSSASISDTVARITLETTLPGSLPVRRISSAHLARFDRDVLTQLWHTDGVASTKLSIRELLNEKPVELV